MTKLTVVVRVRPLLQRELSSNSFSIVSVENGKTISITNIKVPEQNAGDSRERIKRFAFDCCFDSDSTQEDVYQYIGDEISSAIQNRFHSCILAYGQSASGKTHTMIGIDDNVGLAPRICENILTYLAQSAVGSEVNKLNATISYLEIYNEKVRDLLEEDDAGRNVSLKVREHPKKGPYVQGLSEHPVVDATSLLNYLQTGNNKRTVGETNANPRSSRSHSIFTITSYDGLKLRLVDLAGSERSGASRSSSTSRFREGANINKSLVSLKNVISALADSGRFSKSPRKRYVPYRDSILTWLLKDTLDGNSKTILISTISPSSNCYNETVNTLRFGQTAKQIVVQPLINEDPKERTIRELRAEVTRLREILLALGPSKDVFAKFGNDENLINVLNSWKQRKVDAEILKLSCNKNFDCSTGQNLLNGEPLLSSKSNSETDILICEENYSEYKINRLYSEESGVYCDQVSSLESNYETDSKSFSNQSDHSTSSNKVDFDENLLINTQPPELIVAEKFPISYNENNTISVAVELIPMMEVSNTESTSKPRTLRRTFSMDHKMNDSLNGSQDDSKKSTPSTSRKQSIDKRIPMVLKKTDKNKTERGSMTELRGPAKPEVKSKIDSYRSAKPRSQIVAAVTQRLYNKVKKKEVATNTEDLTKTIPKELTICSNARTRLQELTQRALKAHRRKHIETQTDCFPVLRVKEMSTDVDDLKISLNEISDAIINTDIIITKDIGIGCNYLDSFSNLDQTTNAFILTKTCGTSTDFPVPQEIESKRVISFTKYLQQPRIESIPNPIFTSSVNINVTHYINKNQEIISDDSLEEDCPAKTIPDLLSNHNSLEQHSTHEIPINIKIKAINELHFAHCYSQSEEVEFVDEFNLCSDECEAKCILVDNFANKRVITLEASFATQICFEDQLDDYEIFSNNNKHCHRGKIVTEELHSPLKSQELKSIMKPNDFDNVPDSLNYYYKKKVSFSNNTDENLMEIMSNFMKEASTLISNLNNVALKLDSEHEFDLKVTVNDVQGLRKHKCKHRKHRCSNSTQTSPTRSNDVGVDAIPENKYENVVLNNVDRLEKLLEQDDRLENDNQPFFVSNDFYRTQSPDFSSLESNNVFSDYGSLPRRKYKRETLFGCSPSHYLKQLTTMRRKIVKTSRDELLSEAQMHI